MGKFILAALLLWLFVTDSGRQFLDGVLRGLKVETDIAAYDCEKVVAMVRGESLQNVFGGSFRIVEISNVLPQSHCKDAISCTGDVSISNGTTERMLLSVRKSRDAGANGLVYEVRPL